MAQSRCEHGPHRPVPWLLACLLLSGGSGSAAARAAADLPWYAQATFVPTQRVELTLVNDLGEARRNSPVILRREQLPDLHPYHELELTVVDPGLPGRPEPSQELFARQGGHEARAEMNGAWIPYQFDDLDHDGLWDELCFMTDMQALSTKVIHVYVGFHTFGWQAHGTHAAVGSYMRHLVPFWESGNVGWKLWYPTDVDVFAKRTPVLMAHRLYMENLDGYGVSRVDSRYGSDIMQVGNSFGGGGIGLFEYPEQPARISRPRFTARSPAGTNFNASPVEDTRFAFEVLANGPVRSMVRVRTMNWNTGRGSYALSQTYSAFANESYSTARVQFTQFAPDHPGTRFAVGIRKRSGETMLHQNEGVVISSGPESIRNPDDLEDMQTGLSVDFAGTALVVAERHEPAYLLVPDYGANHVFGIQPDASRSFEYLIAAAWSEGAVLDTPQLFRDYVLRTAREFNSPIRLAGSRRQSKSVTTPSLQ